MIDLVVALIRNGACCVKDLKLLPESILHDPSYTAKYYQFPPPHLDQTTPLEIIISLAQLYACISLAVTGFKMLSSKGVFKLLRLNRVADLFHAAKREKQERKEKKEKQNREEKKAAPSKPNAATNDTCEATDTAGTTAAELVRQSLSHETNAAVRNTWEGMALFVTGVGFFWFSAHSLHVTGTNWIGGMTAFIHAFIVMQTALVYFLYCMLKDGAQALRRSKLALQAIEELSAIDKDKKATKGKGKKNEDAEAPGWLNFETYNLLLDEDWNPFWASGQVSTVDKMAEGKMFEKETELLKSKVKSLTESDVIMDSDATARLEKRARGLKWEGYQQYVSFILNFFAFYGYMMALVAYYFDDEESQPAYIKNSKLGYSNEDADWTGNFVGDAMWTVEPILIFSTPFLMSLTSGRKASKKVKSD